MEHWLNRQRLIAVLSLTLSSKNDPKPIYYDNQTVDSVVSNVLDKVLDSVLNRAPDLSFTVRESAEWESPVSYESTVIRRDDFWDITEIMWW